MYKIRWVTVLLFSALVITACGRQQTKSEVLIYKADKTKKKQDHYKTTKVTKETYEEKISTTGTLVYQDEKAVSINDAHAIVDKICVKNDQKVNKGDTLAIYHVKYSNTTMEKKKLEMEQAKAEYDNNLKSKRNEVLEKERLIKNLTNASEKKIARIELERLQREYKEVQKSGKNVRKKEHDYHVLVQKRKRAVLKAKYSGTVGEVVSRGEIEGESATGDTLMVIRNEKDFLVQAEDGTGMRYNMTVDVGLGSTSDDIEHKVKGKVISTDNLMDAGEETTDGPQGVASEEASQLIQISKADRQKYNFEKYNLFLTGVSMKVEDALIVDAKAVYEEQENERTKLYVYVVEKGKLHKRYIVSNYKQDTCYLVNQGVEEGQTLAILAN